MNLRLTNIKETNLDLSKSQFIDLCKNIMDDMTEFDELYKRKELIKAICIDDSFDIDELNHLFSEIIESIKLQQD